jgi:hypothetical protein
MELFDTNKELFDTNTEFFNTNRELFDTSTELLKTGYFLLKRTVFLVQIYCNVMNMNNLHTKSGFLVFFRFGFKSLWIENG